MTGTDAPQPGPRPTAGLAATQTGAAAPNSNSDAHGHRSLASALRAVIGVTLLSRLGGMIRDIMVGRIFGDTATNSALAAAFQIPNLFRRLFGEGALTAAFIPAYTKLLKEDRAEGAKLASLTVAVLGLVTGVLTVLIELVLLAVLLLAPMTPERVLSLKLIMVMLPFMPLICTAAILAGMLQCHGRFGPASSGPLLLNACIVAVATYSLVTGTLASESTAYWIGAATVLSGITQCMWFARLLRPYTKWVPDRKQWVSIHGRAKEMLGKFVPAAVGLGTLQFNTFLDTLIAMYPIWFGPMLFGFVYPLDDRSNGILAQSSRLYQFPLGVFGIAVATAIFPLLSRQATEPKVFVSTLRRGIRLSLFIGLPAAVGLVLVRQDLVSVLFESFGTSQVGFSAEGTTRAAAVVLGFGTGVWAYSLNHVLTRALYAQGDTITPMRVSIGVMAFNVIANCALIWYLKEAGLAFATSISAILQCIILAAIVHKRMNAAAAEAVFGAEVTRAVLRMLLAVAIMAGTVLALYWLWPRPATWSGRLARLTAASVLGGGAFVGVALALRLPELRWMVQRPGKKDGGPIEAAGAVGEEA